ncbi:MAG: AMP-binding protein, partial [Actinomycetia bacterium]|nr:AMP-binding protein [Actinomycetes bacterium]
MDQYSIARDRSKLSPELFWGEAAQLIHWTKEPIEVLDTSNPPLFRWFAGGELNTCYNAVDQHVISGNGDRTAIYYDSALTGAKQRITYGELLDQVSRFAGVLAELGVTKGDRVIVYMPMIPQAVIAMLACARLGAVHSVVFGGFAPAELAARIDDSSPKIVITASCGIEPTHTVAYKPLLDEAITLARHTPDHTVVWQRPELPAEMNERDVDWTYALENATPHDPVPVQATDPLYILYTSGTTGKPKGVVRDNGGHAVA